MQRKQFYILILLLWTNLALMAQTENDSVGSEQELKEVTVKSTVAVRRMSGAENGVIVGQKELFRMACCNLGESFATNPSVDVNYSDAATGAKQIKLLGLSCAYVQMLANALPDFRGSAAPFALNYVPGTWMKSISVSKGAASVKYGYESITGQIDVEYLKTDDEPAINANLYVDSRLRLEANADANVSLGKGWTTNLLAHYEHYDREHDGNDDGFMDMPKIKQGNMMNHWKYLSDHYLFHGGWSVMNEDRTSGQSKHVSSFPMTDPYRISIESARYSAYMKHAFILNPEKQMNIALMANASLHQLDARYGVKTYNVDQKNLYSQLMYEAQFDDCHALSTGVSLVHDYYSHDERETVPGAYVQYTYTLGTKLTAMAGLRWDHSSEYGGFFTPRIHVKYQPVSLMSFRLSAGKGYRTVHALAENHNLLASGRTLSINRLNQESAWNYGVSTAWFIPIADNTLKVNAEYYYTRFGNQTVIDYEMADDRIVIHDLDGKSYSHVMQVDASYPLFRGFTLTAAYRLNDVKCTYGGQLMDKPLTSRYKGLLTAQYKTPLELWQFDVTLQMNGGGRVKGNERFKAYEQLSAQVTREFRHFSVYVGGENLTGFKQKTPIANADQPWSGGFEPTLVWGPIDGAMAYAGIRLKIK